MLTSGKMLLLVEDDPDAETDERDADTDDRDEKETLELGGERGGKGINAGSTRACGCGLDSTCRGDEKQGVGLEKEDEGDLTVEYLRAPEAAEIDD